MLLSEALGLLFGLPVSSLRNEQTHEGHGGSAYFQPFHRAGRETLEEMFRFLELSHVVKMQGSLESRVESLCSFGCRSLGPAFSTLQQTRYGARCS